MAPWTTGMWLKNSVLQKREYDIYYSCHESNSIINAHIPTEDREKEKKKYPMMG